MLYLSYLTRQHHLGPINFELETNFRSVLDINFFYNTNSPVGLSNNSNIVRDYSGNNDPSIHVIAVDDFVLDTYVNMHYQDLFNHYHTRGQITFKRKRSGNIHGNINFIDTSFFDYGIQAERLVTVIVFKGLPETNSLLQLYAYFNIEELELCNDDAVAKTVSLPFTPQNDESSTLDDEIQIFHPLQDENNIDDTSMEVVEPNATIEHKNSLNTPKGPIVQLQSSYKNTKVVTVKFDTNSFLKYLHSVEKVILPKKNPFQSHYTCNTRRRSCSPRTRYQPLNEPSKPPQDDISVGSSSSDSNVSLFYLFDDLKLVILPKKK